jgi:outer membrane protein TolC
VEPATAQAAAPSPQTQPPAATALQAPAAQIPFNEMLRPSRNPINAYRGMSVAPPSLANSPRLDSLVRDGKLYLSLQNAIDLALENNLDLVIARYNIPIAQMDILRTSAGGSVRGVNTGVVSGTPGGAGVGGFGGGAGGGAGGTSGGAGGAGAGASGLVTSTLGTGTSVSNYDPLISATTYVDHLTQLLPNKTIYGVPVIHDNTILGNFTYQQAFPTGGGLQVVWDNNRQTFNSPNQSINPQLTSYVQVYLQQQLLAGFGLGPNLRYLRIARTNQKVSDIAFRAQTIATVTQICNLYWDLVSAYDEEQVD